MDGTREITAAAYTPGMVMGSVILKKRQRMTVFSWIIILLLLTMYIFPLFYMVSTSLKTMYEVNLSPPRLLPSDPQWQNFAEAWRKMNFLHYLKT